MGMYVDAPPPAPEQPTYGESLGEAYDAQLEYAPQLYAMEANQSHGRKAYARLDQEIAQESLVGRSGKGDKGSVAGLIAGQQKTNFGAYDGGLRKAGFDSDGNFLGTSKFESDLTARNQNDALRNNVNLASKYGESLTSALRTDDMQEMLSDQKNLVSGNSSNQGGNIRNYNQRTSTIANRSASNVGDVSSPAGRALNGVVSSTNGAVVGDGMRSRDVNSGEIGNLNGLRSELNNQAMSGLQDGGSLSARDARNVEQDARIAGTARGRGRDLSSVLSEVENKQALRDQREDRSRQFGSQVANQESSLRQADIGFTQQSQMSNQQADLNFGARQQQSDLAMQSTRAGDLDRMTQAQMANQQAAQTFEGMQLQSQQINQQKDLTLQNQLVNTYSEDTDRQIQLAQINKQLYMQGLSQDRAANAQMIGIEQSTSADPFMAVMGRSVTGQSAGQQVYGNGLNGVNSGPSLYNAAQGIDYNSNAAANLANYQSSVYGAQAGAQAAMVGAAMGAAGTAYACWVAREIYGSTNINWVLFRSWLFSEAPNWFRKIYIKYGEKFASFIKTKPRLKKLIKRWMDSKIKEDK